ncbi:MAG: GNAT family N-acetyltransferase [Fuerstia sp.]|nr:GNAT family N-acetyltransferase [Fuerstiella sp.]
MSRFTFHETDTLTCDLARLLRAEGTGAGASDASLSSAATGSPDAFPGIILLYDHRPHAVIGYTREPCETIVISEPIVLLPPTEDVYRAVCGQLIEAVKRRAVSEGARRLQILLPVSAGDAGLERVLTEHGFMSTTEIVQWDLSAAAVDRCLSPDRSIIQLYDFAASNSASALEIQSALDAILEYSEDLAGQPHPTAAELLTRWQRMGADVFVYRSGHKIAGILTCVTHPILSAVAPVAGLTAHSDTNVCIEYIGVVPAFRRRQIASLLIGQIPVLLNSICDSRSPVSERLKTQQGLHRLKENLSAAFNVTAYSDAANAPANSLYQRCGFAQTISRHFWCCDPARNT